MRDVVPVGYSVPRDASRARELGALATAYYGRPAVVGVTYARRLRWFMAHAWGYHALGEGEPQWWLAVPVGSGWGVTEAEALDSFAAWLRDCSRMVGRDLK